MELLAMILVLALAINTLIVWSVLRYFHRREVGKIKAELEAKYRELIAAPDPNIQWAIHAWHRMNFPHDDARDALLGVGEELGEVNRAQIKQSGGIRGSFEYWHQEKAKEIGDVLIGLINYCAWNDIDWLEALKDRWAVISRRDYIRYPEDGGRTINGEE
jgi:NTP pyrophosphatase (non-canonical NTP hydrolase)